MAKMDEYEFVRSQLCAAPLAFRRVNLCATGTHASTHASLDAALDWLSVTDRCTHARIGSHLRVSLRTIRCVICYSTGVRQVRPETVMAIRISSAEVGSESSRNLKKSTPSRPTLSPEPPNDLPRGQKTSPGAPPTSYEIPKPSQPRPATSRTPQGARQAAPSPPFRDLRGAPRPSKNQCFP